MRAASWPLRVDPADPYADEGLPRDGYADYCLYGGTLSSEAYRVRHDAFLARLDAGDTDLEADARALLIWRAPRTDTRTEVPVPSRVPADSELVRIATDLCPTGAEEAADRFLGPLAILLDPRQPSHHRTLQAALAGFAFIRPDGEYNPKNTTFDPGRSAFEQWSRREPQPSATTRANLRACARAPHSAWLLHRREGDRWIVRDLVGLTPRCVPDGPVHIGPMGSPLREPRPGDTLTARIVRGPAGWQAVAPIAIPGGPPRPQIETWVHLELLRGRLLRRALTVDGLLRYRGHVLVRRLCEWAWRVGDDDPYATAALYDLEYEHHDEDIGHYRTLARQGGGPVAELGCGTGRLAFAVVMAGISVHGIDLSQPMLNELEAKKVRLPRKVRGKLTWEKADFRSWIPPQRYATVLLPFNALHHCRSRDEVLQLLGVVRRALASDGLFALDLYLPDLELYDRDPNQRYEERTFDDPRTGDPLLSWEQGWWDADAEIHHVVYVYEHPDGQQERTHLQFRMFTLEQIHEMFEAAGFTLIREAEDFRGTPLNASSLKWVGVLKRATV